MTKRVEYRCNGPDCDKVGAPSDFGAYGHWLTLVIPEPLTPYYNTQYGLAQERHELHFHHPRCLLRWTEAQRGIAWTGEPSVTGKVDPEWTDVGGATREQE